MYTIKNHLLYKNGERVSSKLSPNIGGVITPEIIVIHYTGDNSLQGALSWLCAPQAKVSAHLVIAKTGVVWQLVPFNRRAWHAGPPVMTAGRMSMPFPSVSRTWAWAMTGRKLRYRRTLTCWMPCMPTTGLRTLWGTSDVAPGRKVDPGPRYPWSKIFPGWEG